MSALDTKFADMPEPVRDRWIAWAQSHDWGKACRYSHYFGAMTGAENWESEQRGETVVTVMTHYPSFETPREMRDWAGY